jgi:secreted trypsin-like serine protease
LTVAHCLDQVNSAQIILGAHEFTQVETTQQRFTVTPSNFRIHPDYNFRNFLNDIAIILLPGAGATLNQFVQPVALPAVGVNSTFAGELATVSGWGE